MNTQSFPAWPRFLPDLTLWYEWHHGHGTLPDPLRGLDLPGICRALDVSPWSPHKPWLIELPGIDVREQRGPDERVVSWGTSRGTLRSRWTLGPDGDWWQTEYPVKSPQDFEAALLVAEARRYVVNPGRADVVELPQRPWSEIFHSFLGWSEGLMLFLEEPEALERIVVVLEAKLASLEEELAVGPGTVVLCPDNLDGQFISPPDFDAHLGPSYARVAATMHGRGKGVVVHVGGPVARLLSGLAASGIDCIEGICGPPQGDATLTESRAVAGSRLTLWGGLAQDFLLENRTEAEFQDAARSAIAQVAADPHAVLGVADKVPVGALPDRLAALAALAGKAFA
jgi:hypothetical protein